MEKTDEGQSFPLQIQLELPVGNGLCAVPDGVGGGNGTTHRSCPTAGNAIIHKWVQETENKFPNIAIDKPQNRREDFPHQSKIKDF